jgi:nucleoside-diphosphate-sugar epimerase
MLMAVTQILTSLFHSHRFPSVVLRPTVIYGPGQGNEMFISALIQSLLAGRDFAMTNGEQQRDFIYINDVVDAIIKTVSSGEKVNGAVLNIGAGVSYQIKEVATLVADLVGPNVSRLIQFGAVQYRTNEVMHYSVEIARARELLGWYPNTNISIGLQHTIQHLKKLMVNSIGENQAHA